MDFYEALRKFRKGKISYERLYKEYLNEIDPYEKIWGNWKGGRKILQRIVDKSAGKCLVVECDNPVSGSVSINFPIDRFDVSSIPYKYLHIFEERLEKASINYFDVISFSSKYKGRILTQQTLAEMQEELYKIENERRLINSDIGDMTVSKTLELAFGLDIPVGYRKHLMDEMSKVVGNITPPPRCSS